MQIGQVRLSMGKTLPVLASFLAVSYFYLLLSANTTQGSNLPKWLAHDGNITTRELQRPPHKWDPGHRRKLICPESHFKDILLVVVFNFPHFNNIPTIREMYQQVFPRIYFCGPLGSDVSMFPEVHTVELHYGHFGYVCMTRAIEENPGLRGYMYTNDDVIINWWSLVSFNLSRIWQGDDKTRFSQLAYGSIKQKWSWWPRDVGQKACQRVFVELQKIALKTRVNNTDSLHALATYLNNGKGQPRCGNGYSDFFYIPGRKAEMASKLFNICQNRTLFLEIAVPNVMRMLSKEKEIEKVHGLYLPDIGVLNSYDPTAFWTHYSTNLTFIHPFKLNGGQSSKLNHGVHNILISYGKIELKRRCP